MAIPILTEVTANISDLKKDPLMIVAAGKGRPVAILNGNEPAFYCVPAATYQALLDSLEDVELNAIAASRSGQPVIRITLDEL